MTMKIKASKYKNTRASAHSLKKHSSQLQGLSKLIEKGNQLMGNEDFESASKMYAKVLEAQPSNYVALSNLGAALIRLGRIYEAKCILEYAIELNPKDVNARLNMGAIYQATKDFQGGLKNAIDAVATIPTSALAFNNLGCAFGSINMLNEALHAYQTAQILDPDHFEASLNVGMTQSELGDTHGALKTYSELLSRIPTNKREIRDVVKFYSSFEYLRLGNLKIGWDLYEAGFNPMLPAGRTPRRTFSMPQWNGENLKGKKLLIWREQGIGDELLFSSCLVDLIGSETSIVFECSSRLVKTYQRSFPEFHVRPEPIIESDRYKNSLENYDFHIPLGSLPKILRPNIQDFKKQRPFISIDSYSKSYYADRLKSYASKKLVGICWRSGLLDPLRNRHYSSLVDWGEILKLDDCVFVNLQYGDCEQEIREAEAAFGVKIIRWDDLDLKNDFDEVFSLISCLDAVVSAPTTVSSLSGSLDIPTMLVSKSISWDALGVKDGFYPWYKNTIISHDPDGKFASNALQSVPGFLKNLPSKF